MSRTDPIHTPHAGRFPPDHREWDAVIAAHEAAMTAGRPSYLDPVSGYSVFTAQYLADRGTCCDNRCRHCPYVE